MKRKLISIALSLCMVVAACLTLAACLPDNDAKAQTYVSMDINPSIEFTLDKNDRVLSVYGANEDGQVLLYNEENLVGLKVEQAAAKITELAVKYGYLDEDNKVVQTNAQGKHGDKVLSKVNAEITATGSEHSLTVTCDGANAFSIARKLDNLKAKYPDSKAIQALTPSEFKLVLSASETGEVSLEVAAQMDTSELVAMVSDAHAKTEQYATAAYNSAVTAAQSAFDKAQAAALDGIYSMYFTTHHPQDAYYAIAYQGYKLGAVTTKALSNVLFYAEQACTVPLNEAQIAQISEALGLGSNVDCLKDGQGNITLSSIEAYADKMFKNSELNAELQRIKTELTTALNQTEQAIQQKIDEFNAKYQTELEQIKDSFNKILTQIQGLASSFVPDNVKQQIESLANDVKDVVKAITEIISDGKIRSDEVRALSETLSGKAQSNLSVIEGKLTQSERDEIAALQDKAQQSLASAKAKLDEALTKAQTEAKAYLQQLKDARASK